MRSALRKALGLSLVVGLVLPLWGCEYRMLQVVIPDFDTSAVEGVQIWRLADGTNQPVQGSQLVFTVPYSQNGQEIVDYTQLNPDGSQGILLQAVVERSPTQPDTVQVRLYYYRMQPQGWYRVSTFNEVGTSELSLEKTYL